MLPTFVCIGAQKTGTTWLYAQLMQHPQIFLPTTKELNFFYRDLPNSWYEDHFREARVDQTCGDISPNYMVLPGVAERMHTLLPDARLICMLREPVARAASQYRMAVKLGNIPADVPCIEAFRRNLQYLRERGQYAELLERFARYYPRSERLQILLYDDMIDDPVGFLQQICTHIGVAEDFKPKNPAQRIDAGGEDAVLSESETAEMRAFYAPHLGTLERYLDRHLSSWHKPELI